MIGYAVVDITTNNIKNIMSWGDVKISEDYPINADEYILTLSEDIYTQIQNNIMPNIKLKIINVDGLTYAELIQEIIEEVVIDVKPNTDERLGLLEQAMNDLLLGGM